MSKIFKIRDYILFKSIGEGAFGKVFLSIKENSPDLLVIKVIDFNRVKQNHKNYDMKKIEDEIKVMKILKNKHPNIIKLYDTIYSNPYLYIIMEYCNGGNLSVLLENYKKKYRKPFSIKIIQYFMKQILEGISYIHSLKIIHRDLKLANILINFKNISRKNETESISIKDLDESDFLSSEIKIIDFGLAKQLENSLAKTILGTPSSMAPEVIEQSGYDEKADIWSLGTICYQMLTGDTLFNANSFKQIKEKMDAGKYSIPINLELSNEIISFLNSMLKYNENKRESAKSLLKHDFLTKDPKSFGNIENEKIPIDINAGYMYIYINTIEEQRKKEKFNISENNINELKKYIDSLLKEYEAAKEYFKKNNLEGQEKDAENKCNQIQDIQKILLKGNNINFNILPKQINSEYINGCSSIERKNQFKEILSYFYGNKNKLEVKMKCFEKNVNDINREKIKKEYESFEKIIKELENQYKNIWIPPPKYIKEMKLIANEKVSFDRCELKIKIEGKQIVNQDNISFVLKLLVNEFKKHKRTVNLTVDNKFYEEWHWKLDENDWKNIDKNCENFILIIEKGHQFLNFNKEKSKNKDIINISKVKSIKEFTFEKQLTPSSSQNIIKFSIIPIISIGKINKTYESKKCISIKKFYPQFEFKTSNTNSNKPSINMNFK